MSERGTVETEPAAVNSAVFLRLAAAIGLLVQQRPDCTLGDMQRVIREVAAGYVPVPVEVLEQAIEALERTVRLYGGSQVTQALEALRAAVQGEGAK